MREYLTYDDVNIVPKYSELESVNTLNNLFEVNSCPHDLLASYHTFSQFIVDFSNVNLNSLF